MRKRQKKTDPLLTKTSVLSIFREERRPLSFEDLQSILGLQKKDRKVLKTIVQELIRDGLIVRLRNRRFGVPTEMNLVQGILSGTRSGNAFVLSEKEGESDIFIPSRSLKGALGGDRVLARIEHRLRGKREGTVVKVLHRRNKNIVGFIKKQGSLTFLLPADEKISHRFIVTAEKGKQSLREGDLAAAKITLYPDNVTAPECKVLAVFPGLKDPPSINKFVGYKYGLPARFTRRTEAEAKALDYGSPGDERTDLRPVAHVTIDGEFAKDFDDAVSAEKTKEGYILYVSIADVSHFVLPGSGIDHEALERGTSVYFPGSVTPMLPRRLSNDICSLNPRKERLTVTARLVFDEKGNPVATSFSPSIIQSSERLTYKVVEKIIVNNDIEWRKKFQPLLGKLETMAELAHLLKERRNRRGNLDFDLPEPDIILDMEGGIREIIRSERLFAHSIIEEFMIAANEAVAEHLVKSDYPAIFRIHEPPDREKLRDFERLLQTLPVGVKRHGNNINQYLQAILEEVRDTEYEFFVNRVMLRSMKQARYSPDNKGHFGLSSQKYLHFTSPIRRYPDLVCHRVLKKALLGEKPPYSFEELEKMSSHLSEMERQAMEAERETEERLRILFMKEKIGETYEGIISHITSFGIFVELFQVFVEGVVLLTDLCDDYYIFQEEKMRLVGRRTRKSYRIGDKVRVKVILADVETKRLHFMFE